MTREALILSVWIIFSTTFWSIIASLVAAFYYGTMLKVNVIDKKYNGSWIAYIKSIWQHLKYLCLNLFKKIK